MMLCHSDPESKAFLEARKVARDLEWLAGQIGEPTYLRSLMIYGYSDNDAKTELNLLKLAKRRI